MISKSFWMVFFLSLIISISMGVFQLINIEMCLPFWIMLLPLLMPAIYFLFCLLYMYVEKYSNKLEIDEDIEQQETILNEEEKECPKKKCKKK